MFTNRTQIKTKTSFLAIAGVSPFALLALWNLWTPYSYWVDELYSVVGSTGTWQFVIDSLLTGVHPPLYQFILKFWIDTFGNNEVQTRILSGILAFATLGILFKALRDKRPLFQFTVATFFTSSFLFVYYSQNTRAYSLLLFLATAATVQDLTRKDDSNKWHRLLWYAILFALSLTHYFGLALACLLLLGDIVRLKSHRAILERTALGALISIWPIIHLFLGNIEQYVGGNHWITSKGIGTTVRMFAEAVFAAPISLMDQLEKSNRNLWLIFIVLNSSVFVLMLLKTIKIQPGRQRRELFSLLARIGAFIFVIAIIDYHTPISWPRYYIVLLPAVALSFGYIAQFWWDYSSRNWQRVLLSLCFIVYLFASGMHTYKMMSIRWGPDNGWKGLAAVVNNSGICRPHCWFFSESSRLNLYSHYFSPSMGDDPHRTILTLEGLLKLSKNSHLPIVAAHIKPFEIDKLREHYADWQCLEPRNDSQTPVILLAPQSYVLENLKLCQ
jgi:uncharacterized membrane protein